jgi:hypothetical protein
MNLFQNLKENYNKTPKQIWDDSPAQITWL